MNKKILLMFLCLNAFYAPTAKSEAKIEGCYAILLIAHTSFISFLTWHNTMKIQETSKKTDAEIKYLKMLLKKTQNTLEKMCADSKDESFTQGNNHE